jgi:hypothetical protein
MIRKVSLFLPILFLLATNADGKKYKVFYLGVWKATLIWEGSLPAQWPN